MEGYGFPGTRALPDQSTLNRYLNDYIQAITPGNHNPEMDEDFGYQTVKFEETTGPRSFQNYNWVLTYAKPSDLSILPPSLKREMRLSNLGNVEKTRVAGLLGQPIWKEFEDADFHIDDETLAHRTFHMTYGREFRGVGDQLCRWIQATVHRQQSQLINKIRMAGYFAERDELSLRKEIKTRREQYPTGRILVIAGNVMSTYIEQMYGSNKYQDAWVFQAGRAPYQCASAAAKETAVISDRQLSTAQRYVFGHHSVRALRAWDVVLGYAASWTIDIPHRTEDPTEVKDTSGRFGRVMS